MKHRWWLDLALLVALGLLAGNVARNAGQDINWDLQNYHFYDPWAWIGGRTFDRDLAVAQLQTFHNPLLDVPFYAMVAAGWPPSRITFLLAMPAAIGAYFLAKISVLLFAGLPLMQRVVTSLTAFVIGVTASIGVGNLGTTMNEWPGAAFTMAALWLILRAMTAGDLAPLPARTLLMAGGLMGLATGLKLTVAVFAIGLCAALALRAPYRRMAMSTRLRDAMLFGVAVLAGTVVTYGFWGIVLWRHFGSPVFPYFNEVFESPWWPATPVLGRAYGPHSLAAWLVFPFALLRDKRFFVSEVYFDDYRMPLLYALGFVALFVAAVRGLLRDPAARCSNNAENERASLMRQRVGFAGIFFVASFLLWTAQYSIYRYIVPLELVSGVLIVALLRVALPARAATIAAILVTALLVATTTKADWGRIKFGTRWFEVETPEVVPGAMVLLMSDAPMGYIAPFFPGDPAFVGLNNNLIGPGRSSSRLADAARARLAAHTGPLYALTHEPGQLPALLTLHGLAYETGGCGTVKSNVPGPPLTLCRVHRALPMAPVPSIR